MSLLAILAIVAVVYIIVGTVAYALMKTAAEADRAVEQMFNELEEGCDVHDDCGA